MSVLKSEFLKSCFLVILSVLFLLFSSCSKVDDSNSNSSSDPKIASVSLKISYPSGIFWIEESDPLILSVELRDSKGLLINNYSGKVTYFANGKEIVSNQYNFTEEGTISFKATADGIESPLVGNYIVKNPQKELDKLVITNTFYSKYAVIHTLLGSKPELSFKGLDKFNSEVPIKKGLRVTIGNENINIDSFSFQRFGSLKILASAYGKQTETTFEVRKNRTFEVVRIPIVFHFCQPSPFTHTATQTTDAQFIDMAIEQLKNGKKLAQLNAMFRNKFVENSNELDPNASDSFIEFYLAENDPNGSKLKEPGINRLNFSRPYVPLTETYVYNENQRQFEIALEQALSKWNTNKYFNIVVENFGNWGYAGLAKMSMIDNNRRHLIPQEYINLPIVKSPLEERNWGNTNSRLFKDHVRINGASNILTESPSVDGRLFKNSVLSHEIGHALGLPHTFGQQENCTDHIHSDGLFDTPRQVSSSFDTSCDGIRFRQRNLMNYISSDHRGSFSYDQITIMRARIEASFNIPTPNNKGRNSNSNSNINTSQHEYTIID
jgi:hypothetical protein